MPRRLLQVFGYLTAGAGVLGAALFLWLYFAFQPSKDEVSSVASPDGGLVASLVEVNGGATTSFGYSVLLAEPGLLGRRQEVASLYGAVRNDSAYGANLRWTGANELSIEFLDAKTSEVLIARPRIAGREVAVVLRPYVRDESAPAGGMLYNLQSRRQ
jgi:hypothetical protein